MSSFADFKKKQAKLSETVSKMAEKPNNSYQDDRFWTPTKDKVGNAVATIRLLPQQDFAKSPFQLTFRHGFQTAGKWFIEPCPITIGEKCPICEHSSSIWNSNEDEAREYWRTKTYIANILVIDDTANEENNGKVFLWKFGKSLYNIIMETVAPEDAEEEGVNVFDFDNGLNFKLKLVQKGGYNNYDKSKFLTKPVAVAGGDQKVQEEVYNNILELDEFIDPKLFKSYDELLKKFSTFVGSASLPTLDESIKNEIKQDTVKEDFPVDDEVKDVVDDEVDEEEDFDFDALLSED